MSNFIPKKTKFKHFQRGTNKNPYSKNGRTIQFGQFALVAKTHGIIKSNQIEAARKVLSRCYKGNAKIWIRIFPNQNATRKSSGNVPSRMGRGKGEIDYWFFKIQPGRIIFEVADIDEQVARKAMKSVASKLSFRTEFSKEIINK